jgi:hypothetical protein
MYLSRDTLKRRTARAMQACAGGEMYLEQLTETEIITVYQHRNRGSVVLKTWPRCLGARWRKRKSS